MSTLEKKRKQNIIARKVLEESDLAEREKQVVAEISKETGFTPSNLLGRSAWWGSKHIGAFHYLGKFEGMEAVLKVQGVRPETSEIFMISSFAKQNRSKIIRPPQLYTTLPWDDQKRYEALIMEHVGDRTIVNVPTDETELEEFFELFAEYRKNCRNTPWLEMPEETIGKAVKQRFTEWRKASFKVYPEHPFREDNDKKLIDAAVEVLIKGYSNISWEFQHGHISDSDYYKVGSQVVLLSNLYWGFRAPFYDSIFAYHWFMYHLADVKNITPEKVEKQRELWLSRIHKLPEAKGENNQKLLKLALLERAAAGLNLDALSVEPDKPLAEYLVRSTRDWVKKLVEEVEK
ncbi:MAG: hypothetical protein ACC618_02120 [Patescibacteria group bacterium]